MNQDRTWKDIKPAGYRFYLGIIVFIVGFTSPAFIPLVAAANLSLQWKTAIVSALAFGIPEVLSMVAVVIMGKAGFNRLKELLAGFMKKHGPPEIVSRTRYRIGLVMFVLPLLFGWLAPYGPDLAGGINVQGLLVNISLDLLFVTSFFVLGGEFWDKIRALFVHDVRVQHP
jgi:hypothetical protein